MKKPVTNLARFFDMTLYKANIMKKQPTNSFTTKMPDELKLNRNTLPVAKKPTYTYTEEDLGEGILDVGISA